MFKFIKSIQTPYPFIGIANSTLEKEKIHLLKKELNLRSQKELVEVCLSMAKLKTENKEMLTYLLFDAEDPLAYAQRVKSEILLQFEAVTGHYYYSTKSLRKTLRLINKYSRFTKFKQGETELLLYFSELYLKIIPAEIKHLPLLGLQYRSLSKAVGLIQKMQEDLQYDYSLEYSKLREETLKRYTHWVNDKFSLTEL